MFFGDLLTLLLTFLFSANLGVGQTENNVIQSKFQKIKKIQPFLSFNFDRGSKLIKELKQKGNYTNDQLKKQTKQFIQKFQNKTFSLEIRVLSYSQNKK